MDIKQIKIFVAVYETCNISLAAELLNATQPGLSFQIKQLERSLCSLLFERSSIGVEPTLAGQKLYPRAISILRSIEETRLEINELKNEISGIVKLGLVPAAIHGLEKTLLPNIKKSYPEVQLIIKEAYSLDLTNWVHTGALDFAIITEPPNEENLETEKLIEEKLVLISARSNIFRHGQPIDLAARQPIKLILPTPRNSLRKIIDQGIHADKIHILDTIEIDSVYGSIEFARNSDWSTILPFTAIALEKDTNDLCVNPIRNPNLSSNLFLIHRATTPLIQPARLLVELLKDQFKSSGNQSTRASR